jgi:predicted nucleic acid-binding protein
MAAYLDSSALVKLVVRERESSALRRFLRTRRERVSCALARAEVLRAVRHLGPAVVNRARRVLRRVDLVHLDDSLLDAAGMLDPRILRSLDAVHLAAAQLIAPELDAIVTYDKRLAEGALLLGFHVEAPGGR